MNLASNVSVVDVFLCQLYYLFFTLFIAIQFKNRLLGLPFSYIKILGDE